MPSWNDLKSHQPTAPAETESDELAKLAFGVLGAGLGAQFLEKLHEKHVDRAFNPSADERALRVFAAESQFVLNLQRLVSRGRELHAKRSQK